MNIIIGLGESGFSIARFLLKQNKSIIVMDTRAAPPCLERFQKSFPNVKIILGNLDESLLLSATEIILSPGVPRALPPIAAAIAAGQSVIGDIELFARAVTAPVIAITGTNAKSTVTTLVGEMAKTAGLKTAVGGNLGTPALDLLLDENTADLFVLELSSFQLESTVSLKPTVATVLNVTADHLDRYRDFAEYSQTKKRIYHQAEKIVCYLEDPETDFDAKQKEQKYFFSKYPPKNQNIFGLIESHGELFLAQGEQLLLSTKALILSGQHNQLNALAALAIGYAFGLPMVAMLTTLKNFRGLPHRCQWVREHHDVVWYNDSKGTNVGATIAAIEGLSATSNKRDLILIAGGVGKGADFSELATVVRQKIKAVILLGEAAQILAKAFENDVPIQFATSMQEAVYFAEKTAKPGDRVLLSPACASLDMFKNFEQRGEVFMQCVNALS